MNAVGLHPWEVAWAAHVGADRCLSGIKDGRSLGLSRTDQGFDTHALGAVCEYALAKHLNVCWVPRVGSLDTDVGDVDGYQVRAGAFRTACLIVKPQADPEHLYVLAVVEYRAGGEAAVRFYGPLAARAAMQAKYRRDDVRDPAYFVPQSALRPMPGATRRVEARRAPAVTNDQREAA